MSATPSADHGRFCWYDLMSTDPDASLAFYGALFGWSRKSVEMGGGHTCDMIHAGELPIGGIVPLDASAGIPTHWMPYVNVDVLEDACAAAVDGGGAVCVPPTDIGLGHLAVITDPQGGALSLWQGKEPLNPEPSKDTVGVFCWNECLSTDAAAGAAYYGKLFGWPVHEHEMSVGEQKMVYRLFFRGEGDARRDHAGIMDLPPPAVEQGARSHWLSYVTVEDVDGVAAEAVELGATMLCPCTDIPDVGRFCVIQDPQGGMLSLYKHAAKE